MALNHYILVRTFCLGTALILVAEQVTKIGMGLKLIRVGYVKKTSKNIGPTHIS